MNPTFHVTVSGIPPRGALTGSFHSKAVTDWISRALPSGGKETRQGYHAVGFKGRTLRFVYLDLIFRKGKTKDLTSPSQLSLASIIWHVNNHLYWLIITY